MAVAAKIDCIIATAQKTMVNDSPLVAQDVLLKSMTSCTTTAQLTNPNTNGA